MGIDNRDLILQPSYKFVFVDTIRPFFMLNWYILRNYSVYVYYERRIVVG